MNNLKISIWNLMRPNSTTIARNCLFTGTLNEIDPDIIILTETNSIIDFGDKYSSVSTKPLPRILDNNRYRSGENRVTIFSKFAITRQFKTSNNYTSVCAEIKTPFGKLIVYGTVIGFLGGLLDPFKSDLQKQILYLKQLTKMGDVCFGGDLNVSFSGRPYPSNQVVKTLCSVFDELDLTNLTKGNKNSAIHCVISNSFLKNKVITKDLISFDKKVTDHSLVTVNLSE